MNHYKVVDTRKVVLLSLLAFNPFVIQTVLIDGHNDIIVLTLVLAGLLCFLRQKNSFSILFFSLGAFIKYSPALLVLLPLLFLYRDVKMTFLQKVKSVSVSLLLVFSVGMCLYLPFGIHSGLFRGLANEITQRGASITKVDSLGSVLLKVLLQPDPTTLRMIGISLAFCIFLYLERKKPISSIVFSYIGLFLILPWFQPWYMLWIFPLFILIVPLDIFVFTSIFLLFVPELFPASASVILILYILFRQFSPFKKLFVLNRTVIE